MNRKVIVAKDLRKSFRISRDRSVDVLRGLNLSVGKGEFVSIMGPSGSGKSTLMNLIGCIDTPTKGELNILGENMNNMNESSLSELRAERIGFVFQSFNLLSSLSALENVELVMRLRRKNESRSRRFKRAKELLRMVNLLERSNQPINKLSGGEKQRVAIVRALANDPEIILADEPTGNLDSRTTEEIVKLLHEINTTRGTTIIMVTHNEATTVGTRVLNLVDGRIV